MSTEPGSPLGRHPTLATLAELDEGLLAAPAAARVRVHLERCAGCLARLTSVTGVRTALAAAPAEALPTAVGSRLDAALARAAAGSAAVPARRPVPRSARWQWRPGGGVLAGAAAASIVVLLFGALVLSAVRDGSHTASNSGGEAQVTGPRLPAGTPAATRITASGRNYTPGTLPSDVPRLLSPPKTDQLGPSPGSLAVGAGVDRLRDPRALQSCVGELAGRPGVRAIAVDLARYGGRPAAVVVLPENGAPSLLDVWVVGPGCRTGDPQLLYFRRLPAAGMSSP